MKRPLLLFTFAFVFPLLFLGAFAQKSRKNVPQAIFLTNTDSLYEPNRIDLPAEVLFITNKKVIRELVDSLNAEAFGDFGRVQRTSYLHFPYRFMVQSGGEQTNAQQWEVRKSVEGMWDEPAGKIPEPWMQKLKEADAGGGKYLYKFIVPQSVSTKQVKRDLRSFGRKRCFFRSLGEDYRVSGEEERYYEVFLVADSPEVSTVEARMEKMDYIRFLGPVVHNF